MIAVVMGKAMVLKCGEAAWPNTPRAARWAKPIRSLREARGAEFPSTLLAPGSLAEVRIRQGRFEEAVALETPELEAARRTLGEEHPTTLDAMSNLAETYPGLRRYDLAEPFRSQVLERRQRVFGPRGIRARFRL